MTASTSQPSTLSPRGARGFGTTLLREVQRRFPDKPISADVLAGNGKGEAFYEARGFEPRETLEARLFEEPVVERRWWLAE